MVHLSPFRLLLPFIPAGVVLPFLLLSSNRRLGAWSMLVPYGLVVGFALLVNVARAGRLALLAPGIAREYSFAIALASSFCLLALMTYAVPGWSAIKKWLAVPVLFVVPATVVSWSLDDDGTQPLVQACIALSLLISLVLAGRRSRTRWNLGRFTLGFFVWNLISNLVLFAGLRFRMVIIGQLQWRMFLALFVPTLVRTTGLLFVIAFPFILTAFLSKLYRERLMAAFGVAPSPPREETLAADSVGAN